MSYADDRHATDDLLERYSIGRLAGQELDEFEEHLLVCPWCQDRLAHEDSFSQGMTRAAAIVDRKPVRSVGRWLPKPVWVLSLAAVILLVVVVLQRQFAGHPAAPPAMVVLQATRGTESAGAPAGQPIMLALDLTDLPQFSEYSLEVVDAAGRQVFQSKAAPDNNQLRTLLTPGLPRGTYFVRVYSLQQELLREYALTLHP